MVSEGFKKLYWGFLFIMLSFRLQGFDILPDVLGFFFLYGGLGILASESDFFQTAQKYTLPMIFLSILTIYEAPVQGGGVQFGFFGPFGILIGIASIVLTLLVAYNTFMGIREMAQKRDNADIAIEAEEKWNQFKLLKFASLLLYALIFVPPIAFMFAIGLFIASILVTVGILRFINKCEEDLLPLDSVPEGHTTF